MSTKLFANHLVFSCVLSFLKLVCSNLYSNVCFQLRIFFIAPLLNALGFPDQFFYCLLKTWLGLRPIFFGNSLIFRTVNSSLALRGFMHFMTYKYYNIQIKTEIDASTDFWALFSILWLFYSSSNSNHFILSNSNFCFINSARFCAPDFIASSVKHFIFQFLITVV